MAPLYATLQHNGGLSWNEQRVDTNVMCSNSLVSTWKKLCNALKRIGIYAVVDAVRSLLFMHVRLLCSSGFCLGLLYEFGVHLLDLRDDERLDFQRWLALWYPFLCCNRLGRLSIPPCLLIS